MGLEITTVEVDANLKGFMRSRRWEGRQEHRPNYLYL